MGCLGITQVAESSKQVIDRHIGGHLSLNSDENGWDDLEVRVMGRVMIRRRLWKQRKMMSGCHIQVDYWCNSLRVGAKLYVYCTSAIWFMQPNRRDWSCDAASESADAWLSWPNYGHGFQPGVTLLNLVSSITRALFYCLGSQYKLKDLA